MRHFTELVSNLMLNLFVQEMHRREKKLWLNYIMSYKAWLTVSERFSICRPLFINEAFPTATKLIILVQQTYFAFPFAHLLRFHLVFSCHNINGPIVFPVVYYFNLYQLPAVHLCRLLLTGLIHSVMITRKCTKYICSISFSKYRYDLK